MDGGGNRGLRKGKEEKKTEETRLDRARLSAGKISGIPIYGDRFGIDKGYSGHKIGLYLISFRDILTVRSHLGHDAMMLG